MENLIKPNRTYSIILQDRPKKYQSRLKGYPVSEAVARKFYFQFLQLWGKKVKFDTTEGLTVEGYLNKVHGKFL